MSPTSQATVRVAKPNMFAGQLGVKHINKYFKSFQINIGDRKICMSRKRTRIVLKGNQILNEVLGHETIHSSSARASQMLSMKKAYDVKYAL